MNWKTDCAVVIPCANEARTISEIVGAVRKILPQVIVVDDGSEDGTGEEAVRAGAEVIRSAAGHGKGAALRVGWRRAAERGFSWALTVDGDGQHAAEDIPKFLAAAARGDADLVIGNRMGDSQRMPWLRRRVNRWMSWKLSQAAGMELPDSQCGFRLMRLGAWATLELRTEHFEIESELLLGFVERKYAVKFVPVQVIYRNERSKIHPLRDMVRWFKWWRGRSMPPVVAPDRRPPQIEPASVSEGVMDFRSSLSPLPQPFPRGEGETTSFVGQDGP